jgi:aspartyl-tRNA(Asn)/glutamyl-tRNA(Gln) amidotransferase subunit B
LKDEAKAMRLRRGKMGKLENGAARLEDWELTVGIEIHAQLDTNAKLFSGRRLHRFWLC